MNNMNVRNVCLLIKKLKIFIGSKSLENVWNVRNHSVKGKICTLQFASSVKIVIAAMIKAVGIVNLKNFARIAKKYPSFQTNISAWSVFIKDN